MHKNDGDFAAFVFSLFAVLGAFLVSGGIIYAFIRFFMWFGEVLLL